MFVKKIGQLWQSVIFQIIVFLQGLGHLRFRSPYYSGCDERKLCRSCVTRSLVCKSFFNVCCEEYTEEYSWDCFLHFSFLCIGFLFILVIWKPHHHGIGLVLTFVLFPDASGSVASMSDSESCGSSRSVASWLSFTRFSFCDSLSQSLRGLDAYCTGITRLAHAEVFPLPFLYLALLATKPVF